MIHSNIKMYQKFTLHYIKRNHRQKVSTSQNNASVSWRFPPNWISDNPADILSRLYAFETDSIWRLDPIHRDAKGAPILFWLLHFDLPALYTWHVCWDTKRTFYLSKFNKNLSLCLTIHKTGISHLRYL